MMINTYEYRHELLATWFGAGDEVSDEEMSRATRIYDEIFSDIEDHQEHIDLDDVEEFFTYPSPDLYDYAHNIAFDLMTCICFGCESYECIRWPAKLCQSSIDSLCDRSGLPESVVECIIEFNRRWELAMECLKSGNQELSHDILHGSDYPNYD